MPRYSKKSKYTTVQTQEITMTALEVLNASPVALTIDEICAGNPYLSNQTPQKMARVLTQLNDFGFIKKSKSKEKGRMVYMSIEQLEKQGYEVN